MDYKILELWTNKKTQSFLTESSSCSSILRLSDEAKEYQIYPQLKSGNILHLYSNLIFVLRTAVAQRIERLSDENVGRGFESRQSPLNFAYATLQSAASFSLTAIADGFVIEVPSEKTSVGTI